MSPTNTITPPDIDEGIRQFCSELAPGHVPVYVDVAPYKGVQLDDCFINVRDIARLRGGKTIHGWTIWLWPRVMYDAVHHAVWEKPNGTMVDATPKADGKTQMLFLPDPMQTHDFETGVRTDNVRKAIADDDDVHALISLSAQLHALLERNRLGPEWFFRTREMIEIDERRGILARRLSKKFS